MQIKLKELLENMTAEGGEAAAAESSGGDGGVVEATVQDGPSVASACPPTPRRSNSSIQAAIDAVTLDDEALAQSEFFNPPADPPRITGEIEAADIEEEVVSHRPVRRTTPPPPPPPASASTAASADEELESQTFSPGMLSPLSRRPPSGIVDPPQKPPKRDSGLIDVRSMAAAYREYDGLAKKNKDGSRSADVETVPLPILGGSEHTSPILLPSSQPPAGTSKWLYGLVAVLGLIVVIGSTVAVTALILKRRDDGGKSFSALGADERAALCEEDEAARLRADEERERMAAARSAPTAAPGTAPETESVIAADLAGSAAVAVPASASSSKRAGDDDDDDADDERKRRRRGEDDEREDRSTSSPASSTAATSAPPPAPTPAAAPAPSKPAASDDLAAAAGGATGSPGDDGEKCDEVTCLVSGKGCCGKNAKGAAPSGDSGPAPDPSLPVRPERSDISAGVASVQGRLQSCGDRHSVRGAVTVKIAIAPSGDVKSASTSQGNGEFQSCIAGAIKAARFPATQQGARVNYPVMIK